MIELTVSENEINQRLDKYLLKYFNKAPKSFVYKMLRKKNIKYNNCRAIGNEILKSGDVLQFFLADDTISKFREIVSIARVPKKFNIIFEDENVLFVFKPAGVLSHPQSETDNNTLIDQVLSYLFEKGEYNPNSHNTFKPALCNRLDRNTSGIISIGKNIMSMQELNYANKNGLIDKIYLALVTGKISQSNTLTGYHVKNYDSNEAFISKLELNNSKKVITQYNVKKCTNDYSLLEVFLITGKSHQIRAHFKSLGHYVVGDKKYGDPEVNTLFRKKYALNNQFLHAYKIIYKKEDGLLGYLKDTEFVAPMPRLFSLIEQDIFKE